MPSARLFTVLAALALGRLARSEPAPKCVGTNVCFMVAVPEVSSRSGSGNIYFQMQAPKSYAWVALGTGTGMSGSNIFVMYPDGAGNVTLSARQGLGHSMPKLDSSSEAAQLTLMGGSGVQGDMMTANVRCSNCQSWHSGGSMSLSSDSAAWIAAWKQSGGSASTDPGASISLHDGHSGWTVDMAQSTIAADANPFTSTLAATSGDGGDSSGSGSGVFGSLERKTDRVLVAHGWIMSTVFVLLYPLGSILMPFLGKWLVHAAWQMTAFVLMWVGLGLGVTYANRDGKSMTVTHLLFGIIICALVSIQPILGYLHHRHFVSAGKRGPVSYAHIGYGVSLILLGIINGGLGLRLARAESKVKIAYIVVAVLVAGVYVLARSAAAIVAARRIPTGTKRNYNPQASKGSPPASMERV